jgi:hypothetical protein
LQKVRGLALNTDDKEEKNGYVAVSVRILLKEMETLLDELDDV